MRLRINHLPTNKTDWYIALLSLFWLTTCGIIVFCGYWLLTEPVLHYGSVSLAPNFLNISLLLLAIWGLFLLLIFAKIGKQLHIQELRNQPSWIFYIYWGLIFGPILWSFVYYFYLESDLPWAPPRRRYG